MKELHHNLKRVLICFATAFVLLASYLVYDITVFGNRWVNSPYNPRLNQQRAKVTPGDILDREGRLMATTDGEGNRVYMDSRDKRVALCHVVGDRLGYCSTGAETFHASTLLGYNSNLVGQIKDALENKSRKGNDLTMTVDANLQYTASQAMGGNKGAVVVLNYKTGEILTMLSTPGFDPADLDGIKQAAEGDDARLLNRATQGRYPPGSTFKVVVAIAALENGLVDDNWSYNCTGELDLPGAPLGCTGVHGEVNLQEAFAHSCNTAFATLGAQVGAKKLVQTAERLGFNKEFLFQDLTLYSSKLELSALEGPDALARASIGQHEDLMTPMHLAMIGAAVANGGVMPDLKLVNRGGSILPTLSAGGRVMSASTAEQMRVLMRSVVTEGTGTAAAVSGVKVCGKTGSAQVGGGAAAHAWFVGFIEEDEHPLAIAVLVENGDSGGRVAAPVAAAVLRDALDRGY